MTTYEITPLVEFERAHVWRFSADMKPVIGPDGRPKTSQGRHTVGVLAASFDAAYAMYRAKHPDRRITNVYREDATVDFVVDRPEVLEVVKRLGA